jgi:hypothetical protein
MKIEPDGKEKRAAEESNLISFSITFATLIFK